MLNIYNGFKKWFFLFILATAFFCFYHFDLQHYLTLQNLKDYRNVALDWTRLHYLYAFIIYLVLFIGLVACAIPCATIFAIIGGFLFGFCGFIYAEIGTTIGGLLLFLAVRHSFGSILKMKSDSWLKTMEVGFKKNAFHYLLMLRLIPIFPCGICNIGAGALNISARTYLTATALGIAPSTLIYVLLGRGFDNLFLNQNDLSIESMLITPSFLIPLIALILLSFFPIIYKKFK